ncbi:MAG: NifU family protein [Alphaproteobacteria bacterium]
MFIQTETTPNPRTLKFLPGVPVTGSVGADFTSIDEAKNTSPLATSLLEATGVARVYLADNWLAVTADEDQDWDLLKPEVLARIMEHFVTGRATLHANKNSSENPGVNLNTESEHSSQNNENENSEIATKIRELLDTYVRPAVAQDGGDITFRGFNQGIVYLHLQGACAGCPSSTATLKMGIERLLRHHIPDVTEVRAIS